MVALMVLAVALSGQDLSARHVRPGDPRIVALFEAGLTRSATFRRLVEALDQSDVIVYVEPKMTRAALGGYLAHNIVSVGAYRYLHVAVDIRGSEGRLVPLLAHELQHAVEVSQDPGVRDERGIQQLFERLAVKFGCDGTTCSETQAAKDVEVTVRAELKGPR